MIQRFQCLSRKVFRPTNLSVNLFFSVNLNISICLPTFKKEPRNSKHLMSTSKASFQQIANSILIKACPFFLYRIAGWGGLNPTFGENSQIIVLSKRPEICQNICSCKIVSKKARDEVSWKYRTCFLFAPHRNGNPAKRGSMEKPEN